MPTVTESHIGIAPRNRRKATPIARQDWASTQKPKPSSVVSQRHSSSMPRASRLLSQHITRPIEKASSVTDDMTPLS